MVELDLMERMERAETDTMVFRLEALREVYGNRFQVDIRRFGAITALKVAATSSLFLNRVLGLGSCDRQRVDEILDWYASVPCRFDVVAECTDPDLLLDLARRGYRQTGFHMMLYARPPYQLHPMQSGMTIRSLAAPAIETFADIYVQAFGFSDALAEAARLNIRTTHGRPGWYSYLAYAHGTPAAVADLHVANGVASLAAAATADRFRREGCQQALLQHRIVAAAAHGCDLVIGQTEPGSVSQRNMERRGLQVAYTKAVWTAVPGEGSFA